MNLFWFHTKQMKNFTKLLLAFFSLFALMSPLISLRVKRQIEACVSFALWMLRTDYGVKL